MKKLLLSSFAASLFLHTTAQFSTISGYVKDSLSGEILIGASVTAADLKKGAITNNYGYFSLTLPVTGNIIILVSHVSHLTSAFTVNSKEKTSSTFFLPPAPNQLNEVVIMSGKKDFNVQKALDMTFVFEPAYLHQEGQEAYISLQTVDENIYRFYDNLDRQKQAQYNPFVEPVFITDGQFGNKAIGVFGAFTVSDSVRFVFPE